MRGVLEHFQKGSGDPCLSEILKEAKDGIDHVICKYKKRR